MPCMRLDSATASEPTRLFEKRADPCCASNGPRRAARTLYSGRDLWLQAESTKKGEQHGRRWVESRTTQSISQRERLVVLGGSLFRRIWALVHQERGSCKENRIHVQRPQ